MHSVGNKFSCYSSRKFFIISQFNCDFEALKKRWYEVFFSSILQWHYRLHRDNTKISSFNSLKILPYKQINSYGFRKHLLMSIHFFTERDYIYIVTAIFDKTDIPPTGYVWKVNSFTIVPFRPKRLSIWLHWTNFIDNVLILCIMRTAITWWIEAWCQKRIPVISIAVDVASREKKGGFVERKYFNK